MSGGDCDREANQSDEFAFRCPGCIDHARTHTSDCACMINLLSHAAVESPASSACCLTHLPSARGSTVWTRASPAMIGLYVFCITRQGVEKSRQLGWGPSRRIVEDDRSAD